MKVHSVSDKVRFVESVFGRSFLARSGNLDVKCPICDPKDPTKKKLSIRVTDDANHCWVCGFRARSLVPLLRRFAPDRLKEYIDTFLPTSIADRYKACSPEHVKAKQVAHLPGDFSLIAASDMRDPDEKAVRNYLVQSRGITERDLWFFKFGTSNQSRWYRRAIMPSFDSNGEVNYVIGRAIDNWRKPKYDTLDIPKNDVVFNEINIDWKQELVIVEGPFDLISCPDNSVPLLGSTLSEMSLLFDRIISNETPIVIMLDADTMDHKTPMIAKKMLEYNIKVRVVDLRLHGKHDPGEMKKDEVSRAIEDAFVPDWHTNFQVKLRNMIQVRL